MSWESHPYKNRKNLIELVFQYPVWIILYGSGLIFPFVGFTWLIYGLGWYISPKLYPLPHSALFELIAEYLIWVRTSSNYSYLKKKLIIVILSMVCVVVIPLVFIIYFQFLFGLWFGDQLYWYKQLVGG